MARARADGVELTGDGGLLRAMVREVLRTDLEVEMTGRLGCEPYDPAGRGSGNNRSATSSNPFTTESGQVRLKRPRAIVRGRLSRSPFWSTNADWIASLGT